MRGWRRPLRQCVSSQPNRQTGIGFRFLGEIAPAPNFYYELGGMFDAPHGAACAALLPAVLRVNLRALAERRPGSPALARYREVAAILSGRSEAEAADGVAWVEALVRELSVPGLSRWGATEADVDRVVARARSASSMKGNPIELDDGELADIVRASL